MDLPACGGRDRPAAENLHVTPEKRLGKRDGNELIQASRSVLVVLHFPDDEEVLPTRLEVAIEARRCSQKRPSARILPQGHFGPE